MSSEHPHTPAQNVGTIGDSRPVSNNTSGGGGGGGSGGSPQNMSQSLSSSSCQPGSSNNSSMVNLVNQSALSALNSSLLGMASTSHGTIGSPDAACLTQGQQSSTPSQGTWTDYRHTYVLPFAFRVESNSATNPMTSLKCCLQWMCDIIGDNNC